ncbi:hypothetical protein ACJMK2_038845 [Sinanodonta woodiana]|uniref:E3 ubiquitin-protein ligase PPP1R11 n=1 Tax=Sinanodonta woodiana TaxID=1069815 RepID=A0ABD3WE23_SINWO
MAEATASSSVSQVLTEEEEIPQSPTLRLKLRKPKDNKKVKWTTDTVDNENLNKKKSKCCCIYEKPHLFGESSDDDDDSTDHCRGHKGKCYKSHGGDKNSDHSDHTGNDGHSEGSGGGPSVTG